MKRKLHFASALLSGFGMLIMILDAKTAFSGAAEGIRICINTVIPSLFPFFVLSIVLTSALQGVSLPFLHPVCRLVKLPHSCAGILLLSFLGGYPTGAQNISIAARTGSISRQESRRLLSFCNNAGPAFLFGMGAVIFQKVWICAVIWLVHILSALLVGVLTPAAQEHNTTINMKGSISWAEGLKQAVMTMALVCGWVVLFRVIWTVLDRWCLWLLPENLKLMLSGLLELANGCNTLAAVENTGLRFLLFSVWISFGGVCVAMQTFSVLHGSGIDSGLYLPGKLTQAAISFLLTSGLQWLFPKEDRFIPPLLYWLLCLAICTGYHFLLQKRKITVAFPRRMMYNGEKHT